jgi:hypothetical protein
MKKITLLICGISLFSFAGVNSVHAQAVEQGTVIIDPYYGFPNLGKSFAEDISSSDVTVTGVGPAGMRVEYLIADRFGIGVDFIYNSFTGTYSDTSNGSVYDYEATMARTRVHLRFNYHLKASSEDLDLYIGMGAGTNGRTWSYTTNDPAGSDENTSGTLLPFSARLAFGMRYYFTDNIGINSEIAIGGPLMSAGLSIKF